VPGVLSPDETTGRSVPSTTRQETALSEAGQRPEPTEGASPAAAAWQHDLDADASQATAPSPAPSPRPLRDRAGAVLDEHLRSTMKFLVVGGLVFLLDAAMYNLLVFWHPTEGWGHGLLHGTPLTAKVLTIAAASCLTYLGNRLWTFADRPRPETTRSIMLFILVNLIATGLQLACLAFSRYVLGLDSPLADNISGTFIGQVVSTSFRYVTYGRLVFPKR
jgi:putative flippase GtrA